MHPRNLYRNPPDFAALAEAHPGLRQYLRNDSESGRKTIDFKNEEAQRRLTEAIMLRDFGVGLNIPSNRLCPPVPNRMNYVLWIQDIIHAHQSVSGSTSRRMRGLDIGTGATAIYPILVCKLEPCWEMVATELDDYSYECACNNVSSNNLQNSINIEKASTEGPILFPLENQTFDFSMCNPPFYRSKDEVAQSAKDKELPPNAVCTGAEIEMIFPHGGEEGFVGRMVDESERLQTRCKWYTSMLGKMSSVSTIVQALRARSIPNYAITEFVQGQTRRWAIAWSYSDTHLPDSVARISSITPKHALYPLMPPRNTLLQPFPSFSAEEVEHALLEVLQAVTGVSATKVPTPTAAPSTASTPDANTPSASAKDDSAPTSPSTTTAFFVEAQENTWSRNARRKNRQHRQVGDQASVLAKDQGQVLKPGLTCSFRVLCTQAAGGGGMVCSMECQWIYGSDRALFESFVGHVGRKVGVALKGRTEDHT